MRAITIFLLLFFTSSYACASSAAPSTIGELLAQFNVTDCLNCHGETAKEHALSAHARSPSNSRFLHAFRELSENKSDELSQTEKKKAQKLCLSCHMPQADTASEGLINDIVSLILQTSADNTTAQNKLAELKVNCRVCHMLKGMPEGKVQPATIYGPEGEKDDLSHKEEYGFATVASVYLLTSEFCIGCHDSCPLEVPESICSSLHGRAVRHYQVLRSGQPCQTCHMKEKGSVTHRFPVK